MAKTKFSNRKQKNKTRKTRKTRKTKKIKGGAPHKFSTKEELKTAIEQFCNIQTKADTIRQYGHIQIWDVSAITDMSYLFSNQSNFNDNISGWDVSNVTNMSYMFMHCTSFNQPLNRWNVSNVTNMSGMFIHCTSFNQPLGRDDADNPGWNVSNVTTMNGMFMRCTSFNQPLNDWNVSNVTNMFGMFFVCTSFNHPLDSWNVSNVTNMNSMFNGCEKFNQPLNSWNVSNVTNMSNMFYGCTAFNQSLSCWNVSKVSNFSVMFNETSFIKLDDNALAEKIFLINWDLNVNANDIPISGDALFELTRKNMFYDDVDRFNRIKELRKRIQGKIESTCISELGVKRNLPDTIKPHVFSFLHPEQADKYGTSVAKAGPSVTKKHKEINEGDLKIEDIE